MLRGATIPSRQRGFTLIEVMLVITILGILLALAIPDYEIWIENLKTRNAAEGIQNGLRLARGEAARRNTNVDFVQTKDKPINTRAGVSVTADPVGTNWLVRVNDGSGNFQATDFVQSQLGTDGATNVTLNSSGNGLITFTGLGNITTPRDVTINVVNPRGDRALRVVISRGGQVRMCDPNLSTKDTRSC